MWRILRKKVVFNVENTFSLYKETKRFAGHSKWQNIKHIKAAKDGERAVLFAKLVRQMKVAITEEGSYKPSENIRLAQIIEVAKKKNMPVATINGVLEKASKSTTTTQVSTLDVRGPGGCILVVELLTDNTKGVKATLNSIFKKNGAVVLERSARHVFHHKGFVVTKMVGSLDDATEIAIEVGAEDVEIIDVDNQQYLQFTCEAGNLPKVANLLQNKNYEVISREDKFIPHIWANLSDADVDRVATLCAKLEALDEVTRIHDNIA